MPEERPRFERFDRRDEYRPCVSGTRRPHDGCARCASQVLRPYPVVRRYRGDTVARAFAPSDWCDLWSFQNGDVSWPDTRQG